MSCTCHFILFLNSSVTHWSSVYSQMKRWNHLFPLLPSGSTQCLYLKPLKNDKTFKLLCWVTEQPQPYLGLKKISSSNQVFVKAHKRMISLSPGTTSRISLHPGCYLSLWSNCLICLKKRSAWWRKLHETQRPFPLLLILSTSQNVYEGAGGGLKYP